MDEIENGDNFIGVVAQVPFESWSKDGVQNQFCTLQPLAFDDGRRVTQGQFPNRELVWWLLTGDARRLAEPGRQLRFIVENAPHYRSDDREKDMWQARPGSVRPCGPNEMVEIVHVPSSGVVERPNDLVSVVSASVDHRPCDTVLVRWHGSLYGPLRTDVAQERNHLGQFSVSFATPASSSPRVARIPLQQLDDLHDAGLRAFEAEVALDSSSRDRSGLTAVCHYELIPAHVYRELTRSAEPVRLESDAALLRRVAKELLGWKRKRHTELNQLLVAFKDDLTQHHEYPDVESVTAALKRTRSQLGRDQDVIPQIAHALAESGLVDEALDKEVEERYKKYVEDRTAQTTATIEEQLRAKRDDLRDLAAQKAEIESELREKRAAVERELGEKRARDEEELNARHAELDKEKRDLERQRQAVEQSLAEVADRFVAAREQVVTDLLTVGPLLQRVGIGMERTGDVRMGAAAASAPQAFKLGDHVSTALGGHRIAEGEFFERFTQHVRDSGYVYEPHDLVAFHVSVKVSDLTVLGGVSGTGKSSLPRLYAQALAGDECSWMDRYRLVGVNPSWLDVGDLLGRVNVLDARFLPSDSGLYDLLIHAHEEHRRHGDKSGLYIVCLDEMNLAQVEHYFSPFLQLLEAPPDQRELRCFAGEAVSGSSDFAKWAKLDLPPSLRFIGTVNFDETTRPLSLRVLDRVNLIKLSPGPLRELDASARQPPTVAVKGPAVTREQFESWRRPGEAGSVAELVDRLRGPFARLGCPLSPRRYRALCAFLAGARDLVSPEEALDMQITQRLLPQVRGGFRQRVQEELKRLRALLEEHDGAYRGALAMLDDLAEEADDGLPFDGGE